jgi:homoserine O-acetyltransferase/O-succinyltransferase
MRRMPRPFKSREEVFLAVVLLMLAWLAPSTLAQSQENPASGKTEGDYVIKNFRFKDGALLPELRLHYLTLGSPHRDASGSIDNAVLLLHSTASDTTEFLDPDFSEPLFRTGKPFDLSKFYLIIPDAIGHGKSSKPSDGLKTHFPHYEYEDMVSAQYRLVKEKLGVTHLRIVMGLSMGGMHTWLWGERYPDMMDALMPISALPVQIAGRNRLWRRMVIEAIRNDPDWENGDYEQQPHGYARIVPLIAMMVSSPVRLYEKYPTRAAADGFYDHIIELAGKRADANDRLYQYDCSRNYDPASDLGKIKAKLLSVVFADDQINSPEFEALDREMPHVKNGRFVIVPAGSDSNGEGNNTKAKLWHTYLEELLAASTAEERSIDLRQSRSEMNLRMPGPDVQNLMLGTWRTEAQYQPTADMPNGGMAVGTEIWRPGPGGMSVIEEAHEKNAKGDYEGLGVAWWDANAHGQRFLWCDTDNPDGCYVSKEVAKWNGTSLEWKEEQEHDGKRRMYSEVFRDITPTSFTQVLGEGEPTEALKTTVLIRATKLSGGTMNQTSASSVERGLASAIADRHKALLAGDTDVVERLTADEYVQTDISGYVQDKSAWLNEYFRPLAMLMKAGKFRWDKYEEKDVQIRVFGTTAVVTGSMSLKGTGAKPSGHTWVESPETTFAGTLRFTRVWVNRDGTWRLAALQNNLMKEAL